MFKLHRAGNDASRACERVLTEGERGLAREIFGDSVDLDRPRIYGRCFLPLAQPRGLAMAPNGNIYFHPADHIPDFSRAPLHQQGWFLHELTHVWQHQRGVRVWLRGLCDRRYRYLPLRPGKPFERYGIEQQGDIVQDYFMMLRGCPVPGPVSLDDYRELLRFVPRTSGSAADLQTAVASAGVAVGT